MKKPTASQAMALQAARMASLYEDPEVQPGPKGYQDALTEFPDEPEGPAVDPEPAPPKSRGGRPRGKRPVAARQTLYLDEARHTALTAIAEDRGRSIHSLILEGIDLVIGKPNRPGWSDVGSAKG